MRSNEQSSDWLTAFLFYNGEKQQPPIKASESRSDCGRCSLLGLAMASAATRHGKVHELKNKRSV